MMKEESPNRFDRIVAILIQLQSRRMVRAHELAERFQVSLRTIYRDVRSLQNAGVPIHAEAGFGYSIMEGYRLPPVMFTREEAASFVAAEKLMEKMTDKSLGAYFGAAMYKVRSVLRNREQEWISAMEAQIRVEPVQSLFNADVPDALEIIMEGIAEQRQFFLRYKTPEADVATARNIEAVGLFHENNYWYILGFCHLRGSYRQFRTDRIVQIRRTAEAYTRSHPSLEALRNKDCAPGDMMKVRIRLHRSILKYIQGSRHYYGFTEEKVEGEQVEMTFMTPADHDGFARWYMMFGDCAEILEPEQLKARVQQLAEGVIGNLGLVDQ